MNGQLLYFRQDISEGTMAAGENPGTGAADTGKKEGRPTENPIWW